jgi:hypothetical protein
MIDELQQPSWAHKIASDCIVSFGGWKSEKFLSACTGAFGLFSLFSRRGLKGSEKMERRKKSYLMIGKISETVFGPLISRNYRYII